MAVEIFRGKFHNAHLGLHGPCLCVLAPQVHINMSCGTTIDDVVRGPGLLVLLQHPNFREASSLYCRTSCVWEPIGGLSGVAVLLLSWHSQEVCHSIAEVNENIEDEIPRAAPLCLRVCARRHQRLHEVMHRAEKVGWHPIFLSPSIDPHLVMVTVEKTA